MHQLLHISESVRNWGPLWAHSAFNFESANYKLLKTIHSAKGVILQILKYLNIQRTINKLEHKIFRNEPSITILLYEKLTSKETKKTLK